MEDVGDPSPKFQEYPVIVAPFPVEAFVKKTVSPRHKVVIEENEAVGFE